MKKLADLKKTPPTSTRTRERLAEVDAKLKEEMDRRTSTSTRFLSVLSAKIYGVFLK